jgi:hypothetical protein
MRTAIVGLPRGEESWPLIKRLGELTIGAYDKSAERSERGAERSDQLAEKALDSGERVALAAIESGAEFGRQAAKISAESTKAFERLLQEAEKRRLFELQHTYQMMQAVSKMAPEQAVVFAAGCAQTVKGQIDSLEAKEEMRCQEQAHLIRKERLDQAKARLKNVLANFTQNYERIWCFGAFVGCGTYWLTGNIWAAGVATGGGLWGVHTVRKWLYGDEFVKNKWAQIYLGAIERMEYNPNLTLREAVRKESPSSEEWRSIPEDEAEGLLSMVRRAEQSAY